MKSGGERASTKDTASGFIYTEKIFYLDAVRLGIILGR
jgi:hypothetical protein